MRWLLNGNCQSCWFEISVALSGLNRNLARYKMRRHTLPGVLCEHVIRFSRCVVTDGDKFANGVTGVLIFVYLFIFRSDAFVANCFGEVSLWH